MYLLKLNIFLSFEILFVVCKSTLILAISCYCCCASRFYFVLKVLQIFKLYSSTVIYGYLWIFTLYVVSVSKHMSSSQTLMFRHLVSFLIHLWIIHWGTAIIFWWILSVSWENNGLNHASDFFESAHQGITLFRKWIRNGRLWLPRVWLPTRRRGVRFIFLAPKDFSLNLYEKSSHITDKPTKCDIW